MTDKAATSKGILGEKANAIQGSYGYAPSHARFPFLALTGARSNLPPWRAQTPKWANIANSPPQNNVGGCCEMKCSRLVFPGGKVAKAREPNFRHQ
jgi:hypothetical protein